MRLRKLKGGDHTGAFAPDDGGSRPTRMWLWWQRVVLLILVVGLTPNCSKSHDVLFVNYTDQTIQVYRSSVSADGERVVTVRPWHSRLVQGQYVEAGAYWVFRTETGQRVGSVLLRKDEVRKGLYDGRLLIVDIRADVWAGPFVRLDETGSSLGGEWIPMRGGKCETWTWRGGADVALELCRRGATAEWYLLYRGTDGGWVRTDGPFMPGSSISIR